jgi:hypothetical protein
MAEEKVAHRRGTEQASTSGTGAADFPSGYQNATDTVLTEYPRLVAEPATRVDHDACRLLPGNPAYGQLRIVGYRSTDADNDRIDQSPQPVEVGQSGRPIDVF